MQSSTPSDVIAWYVMVGAIATAAITALPTVITIFVTDRRSAKRDAARDAAAARRDEAAVKRDAAAARLVAAVADKADGVAVKTEEVKVHLEKTNTVTTDKLDSIEHKADEIHELVNSKYSELLRRNQIIAAELLKSQPDNALFQELARDADERVDAHRPAESTTREERG